MTLAHAGTVARAPATVKTISSGVVTPDQYRHLIAAETGVTDDLNTIALTGFSNLDVAGTTYRPEIVIVAQTGHTITLKHGVDNISLQLGADYSLTGGKLLRLYYDGTNWTDGASTASGGTVTSVGLSTNASYLTVGSSPVTTAGTITLNKTTGLTGNQVVATPDGTTGVADLRALVSDDIPTTLTGKTLSSPTITTPTISNYNQSKQGLEVRRLDNDTLYVAAGSVWVNGVLITKNVFTPIDLATAGNWIGGASLESNSEWVHVYTDASGNLLLYDKHPNYPVSATASRVFTGQINQAGWDGTAGQGLNSATVVYDNDTGEGSIEPGMLMLVYDDASYTLGRGKGSGASATVNNLSCALITAIDTGTNTITLDTNGLGHQIAMNDDDYIIVIENGAPVYAYVSSVWYRWLGALWNDASGNLVANDNQYFHNRRGNYHSYIANEGSDWTTTSTSFVDVDATDLVLNIGTSGHDVLLSFVGLLSNTVTAGNYFDVEINGVRMAGDDGLSGNVPQATFQQYIAFHNIVSGLLPGTHEFRLQWRVSTGTATLYAGAGTANLDVHPQFFVKELT